MFHWHFDTFDLPKLPPPPNAPPTPPPPTGNALLSSTRACRNQAFRFKQHLFGFQYHFEMLEEGIEAMLASAKEDWQKVLGADGDQKIREQVKTQFVRYRRLGDRLLTNFVQFLRVYQ